MYSTQSQGRAQEVAGLEDGHVEEVTQAFTLVQIVDVVMVTGRRRQPQQGREDFRSHKVLQKISTLFSRVEQLGQLPGEVQQGIRFDWFKDSTGGGQSGAAVQ